MNIVNISNASISLKSLKLLLSNGEVQFQTFLHERLIDSTKSIDAPVKDSNYKLPTNDAVKAEKKKLIYAPAILNKIWEFIRVRTEQANQLFIPELFDVAQSITEMKIHSIIVANLIYWTFSHIFFFLSPKLTNHRTVKERGGDFFNSSLSISPASQTLRY